jgi:hypothetical protein
MIDWGKYWIRSPMLVTMILRNENLQFEGAVNFNTGEVKDYPRSAKWDEWQFEAKTATWLEITGSLHKYWNNGTNETDFSFYNLYQAIQKLCLFLQVSPYLLTVHNLEFGVNIRPVTNATEIMREIICFKNCAPSIPINDCKGYFTEYKMDEYYFKVYDKGKQARELWHKECGNIIRIEIKAINNGFLHFASIRTMADLLNPSNLILLGKKLHEYARQLVFDDTMPSTGISKADKKVYQALSNPRAWTCHKGRKTGSTRAQERRFRETVDKYGEHKYSRTIGAMVENKWEELMTCTETELQESEKYLDSYRRKL